MAFIGTRNGELTFLQKVRNINWLLVLLLGLVATTGFFALYSVAGGKIDPWASRQMMRFALGATLMMAVAMVDIRALMRIAYPFYFVSLVLLAIVEFFGSIGMGAQRWLDLGIINLQPSELMRLALVLALARYFHSLSYEDIGRVRWIVIPVLMIVLPAGLVIIQPDLGTALLTMMTGAGILFLVGVRWWKFAVVAVVALAAMPLAWQRLHGYQKDRILTFLNPERDPLGAGYHILQSKIALGSGGLWGKGFLQGTQSHLNFLPEKQTDFVFTTLAEEFGMIGGVALLAVYIMILAYGFAIGVRSRSQFGRLVAFGVTITFFIYIFVNVAMVMGLVPIVGIPLPLVSYGGTAMVTILVGFGLVLSVSIHRDVPIPRRGPFDLF
ncbi:MAG: rod shape-determining protein RodA [Alphaproteobacteria bacterium]|nr:rod shape-determining protein RodA [Alphaproteobacteria bacterium]